MVQTNHYPSKKKSFLTVHGTKMVSVPFESFYKTFKHPGAVLSPRPPSDSDEHTGDEDAVLTPYGVPACCPESVNTYLEMCQKYSTDANAG